MNRIDKKFKELKSTGRKAFIAYICAGDPDIATTRKLVLELDKAGVDIVELGIPFSDPLADGPTIQRASQRALKGKVNLKNIFSLIRSLRKETDIPLVLMGYYNPIYRYGEKRFVRDAKAAGADGVIVPDLSPEEADQLIRACEKYEFDPIFLAAPTSTKKRLKLIASKSKGFIYYVSLTGVTGARKQLPAHIRDHIRDIKRIADKPVCIGFGISSLEQVKQLSSFCDGVIVGSALIGKIEKNLSSKSRVSKSVARFAKTLVKGVR